MATTLLTLTLVSLSAICIGPPPHSLNIGFINNESPVDYSHSFINSINTHIINLIEYNDTDGAENDMKADKISAYLTISQDYTEKMISKLTFRQQSSKVNASLSSKRVVTLHQLKADMNSVTIVHYLINALNASAWRISRRILRHPMLAQSPIVNVDPIAEPELEEDQYNSRNYFIQVFTMHWSFFVFLYLSISTFHGDITTPLYERSISAGSTPTQFILSHLICSLCLPLLISLPVLICIIDIFHATAKGSLFLTWFIYLINSVSAIVTAFCMATMKLDIFIILCCASAYDLVSLFCGAGNISPAALPYFMKPLTWVFPNMHNNEAMIRVMAHGDGLESPLVYKTVIYNLSYILLVLFILRWILS